MKYKRLLFVLPLILPALASCNTAKPSETGPIQLFDSNSRLIGTPKEDPERPGQTLPMLEKNILTGSLPTYHHKDKGDVPYVAVNELANAIKDALPLLVTPGMTTENKSDGYRLYSPNKKGEFIFDAENDTIKLKNGQAFATPILVENNNIPGDYCNYRQTSIKESDKTKVYKVGGEVPQYDTFDFGKYNFDIVKQGDKLYVPLEAFSKVLFRDVSVDLAYNGSEFYSNASESGYLASLIYSSNGWFQGTSGLFYPSRTKAEGEAYRFEFKTKVLKPESQTEYEDCTKFLVLGEDGAGYVMLCKGDALDPSQAVEDTESGYSYQWRKDGNILKVDVTKPGEELGTFQIHLNQTRFLSNNISKEVSEYNYDVLRFMFDTIYGLKDIKGYTDANAFFKSANVESGLKSRNVDEYNTALATLVGYIDDGHTKYNNLSPYSSYDTLDNLQRYVQLSTSGTRYKKLIADNKKYMGAKVAKTKVIDPEGVNPEDDPNYYQGIWFSSDNKTAVIQFNGFGNKQSFIPNMKELFPAGDEGLTVEQMIRSTRSNMILATPDGFSCAFKTLDLLNKNTKVTQNVVIDMTTNGGGEIAIMPYLAAFFSDDPTYTVKDIYNGVIREYHYKVDLNGDGVFGGEGDTYKGKYNFYFLTSNFSFSCGNCLPGMAKDAGAKIIGETSGGGTSPVGVYFDALGSYFNLSNHYDMCYKVNGEYTQNDAGIVVDYSFPFDNGNWYDPNAINTFINGLSAE